MGKSLRDSLAGWLRPGRATIPSKNRHGNTERKSRVSHQGSSRAELILADLDAEWTGRRPTTVNRKAVPTLQHMRRHLAARLTSDQDEGPIPANRIRLLNGQYEVADGDDGLLHEVERVLYQVILCEPSSGLPQIDLRYKGIEFTGKQMAHICTRIRDGGTTRNLQFLIQSMLNERGRDSIDSHLQVEIRAIGGLRPGPIQGLEWEVRGVVSRWFCHRLAIRIRSPNDHIVVKAFNQEYVLSRPRVDEEGTTSVRKLKRWLLKRVMSSVDEGASKGWNMTVDEFACRNSHGRILRNRSRVACGQLVEMSMSRVTEEAFRQAEAWLTPLSLSCITCGDDKRLSEMPGQITRDCEHVARTCRDCVGQWIASSLETTAWDRLRCPECPRLRGFHAVAAFAEQDAFIRYDALATRAAMSSIPNFKWCMNPRCDAGQLYSSSCSRARCRSCKHSLCVRHDIPWHTGETCDQYDYRTRKQRKNDKASKKKIKTTTKPCPKCKRNVHKYTGCDHITCICGHEWCYLCFSEYKRNGRGMLRCQHKQSCRCHADPPFYEGGLPFGFRGPGPAMPPGPRPAAGAPNRPLEHGDFWGIQWARRGDMDFRMFNFEQEMRRARGPPGP